VYCQPLFQKPRQDRSGAPRLSLHSREIGLIHPLTGEPLHLTMELPDDLKQFLDRLRAKAKSTGRSPSSARGESPAPHGNEPVVESDSE
jgi:hypothetical protein